MSDTENLNVRRALRDNDNRRMSPTDTLDMAHFDIKEAEDNGIKYNRCIVLLIEDVEPTKDGLATFGVQYILGNIRASTAIAALELAKDQMVRHIRGKD